MAPGEHPAPRHLLTASTIAWIGAYGFQIIEHPVAVGLCLLLTLVALAASFSFLHTLWRSATKWKLIFPCLLAGLGLFAIASPGRSWIALVTFEMLVLLTLWSRRPAHSALASRFLRSPPALVATTFALLIALGTVLLSFPAATADHRPLHPSDAFFTATSATCVTGLTVVDTGEDLSVFGQIVVLLLIQIGGLGILVFSSFAAALLGDGLGLRGEHALGESLDLASGNARQLVSQIVASTLALEALGATALGFAFAASGMSPGESAWQAGFHAISAFCNAGFSLWTDSLMGFANNSFVLFVVATLITLGGLGFPVLTMGWSRARRRRHRLTTHTRIVLVASLGLTFLGAAGFAVCEWHRSLEGAEIGTKFLASLFQSITLRTAGFNTVDLLSIGPATLLWMLILMFIGASPGGTGGGIKTTTATVLATLVPTVIKGKSRAVVFGRTVPLETIFRAASIVVISLGLLFCILTLLLLTQPIPFDQLLFEAVSALGTVGLSLGATAKLDTFGKMVLVLAMFAGRVGPLTLALLLGRRKPGRLRYPEARIMVG